MARGGGPGPPRRNRSTDAAGSARAPRGMCVSEMTAICMAATAADYGPLGPAEHERRLLLLRSRLLVRRLLRLGLRGRLADRERSRRQDRAAQRVRRGPQD